MKLTTRVVIFLALSWLSRAATATAAVEAGIPPDSPSPISRKGISALVGSTLRAAAGDVDGDGRTDLVLVDPAALRVLTPDGREIARAPVTGGIQWLDVADVERDGHMEILAGWGETPEHRDGAARVSLF